MPERPETPELTRAARDALVRRLLADLAAPADEAGEVVAALRALETLDQASAVPPPDDLAPLVGKPAQRSLGCDHLVRYRAALEHAPHGDDVATRLAQARVLFAAALFFEVHEILEPSWRRAEGDARRILQGVIQAAVACHHGARGRAAPALRAASAAAAKLADAPASWHGFPVSALRAQLDGYRVAVADGAPPTPPVLRL